MPSGNVVVVVELVVVDDVAVELVVEVGALVVEVVVEPPSEDPEQAALRSATTHNATHDLFVPARTESRYVIGFTESDGCCLGDVGTI